ncbi:MAG: toprim domain-containing protein [Azospirillum sp.]|nr:toprim domain-containing protein [Azospirillum sp.]
MPQIDFDRIAADYPISSIVGRRVALKSAGKGEFVGLCPFHNERTPSFTVSDAKAFYHCHGCGAHGDVVDFIAETEGVSIGEAARILTGDTYAPTKRAPGEAPPAFDLFEGIEAAEIPDSHEPFQPNEPIDVWNPRKERVWRMRPSMVFPYRDAEGELLGYVVRVEFDDGKKVTPTLRYVRLPDGRETWATVPFAKPRPLYWARPGDGQVIVVEGEKAADAAARLLPLPVVTWPGGTQGVKHADWAPLAGRKVVIWPDADDAGRNAALEIAERLNALGCSIKIAEPESDWAKGYDAADAERDGWDRERTVAWLRSAAVPFDPAPPPEPAPEPEPHDEPDDEPAAPPPVPRQSGQPDDMPFRVLGFDDGDYFYLPKGTKQVVALSSSGHTWKNLLQLAPLDWWESRFSGLAKANELAAANALMNWAHKEGTFYPERLRGRGAWLEGEGTVYHMGQFAMLGPERVDLFRASASNIYPAARPMRRVLLDVPPAPTADAKRIVELCQRLNWENPLSAVALAGWIVIAPVCGALAWRPHIWITGGAGSGKTTVLFDIVWRLIQAFGEKFEGNTTEAGIRQSIGNDALPVLLDEAEAESEKAQARMGAILDLARLASSGSTVSKGTVSGEAISFTVRSAFCFSSIEHSIKQHADETRITKLVLRKRSDAEANADYKRLMADIRAWLTPEFASAMFLRTWLHIDALLANVATCVDAAAQELRDRRAADQIGTLIAGYVHLHTTKRITFDQAVEFVRRYDWSEHTAIAAKSDKDRLLERILTTRLMVTSSGANKNATLAELIVAARDDADERVVNKDDARRQIAPLGIKVTDKGVLIAASCQRFGREVLRGTQWESDWSRPLRELPGAIKTETEYFAPGLRSRATLLPWDYFEEPVEPKKPVEVAPDELL